MAENILARQHPAHDGMYQWLRLDGEQQDIEQGDLAQLADSASNNPVILLIPAGQVLHLTISLPVTASRQIKKALPYAIEDQLAEEVENYHLAWCKLGDGLIAVAAIALASLHHHQDACQAAGIRLAGIYSELLLIPSTSDCAGVVVEQNVASLRFKSYQGGAIALPALPLVLDKLITEQQLPPRLHVWQADAAQAAINWPDSLPTEVHPLPSALALFASQMPKKLELNLLSAHYQLKHGGGQNGWLPWLPTAALLLLAAGLQWGYTLHHYWQSETLLSNLDTNNQAAFRQTFPDLKRIVNIKAQAQQELLALRKTAGQGQDQGFLFLLYQTGATLSALPTTEAPQLQGMEFANNTLSLSLKAKDIAQLDTLKQTLQQGGLKADIHSTEAIENSVLAHLDISKATPP